MFQIIKLAIKEVNEYEVGFPFEHILATFLIAMISDFLYEYSQTLAIK